MEVLFKEVTLNREPECCRTHQNFVVWFYAQFYHKGNTAPTQGGELLGEGDREKEGIRSEWG